MRLSIRFRTIVVLNVFVLGLSAVIGWIAQNVVGEAVEEQFVRKMTASVSGFFRDRSLPINDTMMAYLHELFDAEWIAVEEQTGKVAGASLSEDELAQFVAHIEHANVGAVRLGERHYRLDSEILTTADPPAGRAGPYRLFMLVPSSQFQPLREKARAEVASVILPAAIIATLLAVLLSHSITRPIRRLAADMDGLADMQDVDKAPQQTPAVRSPHEIAHLSSSFHRLLDRLRVARQRAIQNEQLATLGKVSLSVAHELRNPLSGIKMNLRVLKDHAALRDDPGVEAMLREIDRMSLYIDELMSLSPGGARSGALHVAPTKLSQAADSVLTILSGRCRHAKVEVVRDYADDEPLMRVDADQIRQAIMNLMSNAIEAMPAGGTMTVAVRRTGGAVRLEIADTGDGVRADERDIFEAFVSNKPNGVGLGLYICRQIVDRHQGRIGFDAGAHGATFWLELPMTDAATPTEGNVH